MDDVKARSRELTLCFADPASASGHLIPHAYLKSVGLDPKTSFKETLFSSGHIASVMSVKSGKVDLGCTVVMIEDLLIQRGMLNHGDLNSLWISDPIVSEPIVIRSDINKEFAEKIKQAYLDLSSESPDVLREYLRKIYGDDKSKIDSLKYVVTHDTLYNGLRKLVSNVPDLNIQQ